MQYHPSFPIILILLETSIGGQFTWGEYLLNSTEGDYQVTWNEKLHLTLKS